ncbi:GGDEF domain-containing protein [Shewanella frigidimarina]|uniref:GGDEF domain-containing protein n=1 Tax=Shewanella frigidimarina TaxID=56812 RepID=UPI003FA186D1
MAKRILSTLRSSDTIARLGGDEFLIILPRVTERDSINKVINKLEKHVCELPFRYQDTTLDVCMSMGVARYPQDASTLSDLLHFADEAMYLNKQQKREE